MKKRDFILIAVILVIAGGVFLFNDLTKKKGTPAFVRIHVGDEVYQTIPLTQKGLVNVDMPNGTHNGVMIDDSGIYMHDANCQNQDCVEMGKITLDNYESRFHRNWIVCLPNKVSVELVVEEDAG